MAPYPPSEVAGRPVTNFERQSSRLPRLHVAPRVFTCFARLPFELRVEICLVENRLSVSRDVGKQVCFEPRIIKMNCFIRNKPYGFADHRVEGQSAAPSVLHVCRESRTEAQKHYEVFDDSTRWPSGQAEEVDDTSLKSRTLSGILRPLYINFEADRFVQPDLLTSIPHYIPFRYQIAYNFGPDVCQNIRHLQLETSFDAHRNPFGRVSIKAIRFLLVEMTSLSDITLVVRQTFVPTPRDLMKGRSVEFFSVQLSFQEKENSVLEDLRKALNSAGVPPDNLERTTLRCRFVPSYDEDLVPVSEDGAKVAVQNGVKRSQSLRSVASHSRVVKPNGRCRSGRKAIPSLSCNFV